ncbi:peptidoglycan D,D-transpeptidase FtsI family protein [Paenarthrobacter sp. NPDC090520]|uniref:peptidoglycan D,D-transpeptidase FtsI family protein n=1 Tax=Paenarthrobacter sp. NPDC090520 TaxID=3364382 RepID=UPI0038167B2A
MSIAIRVVVIQGFDPDHLTSAAAAIRTKTTVLASKRGRILDADGTVLADTIELYDIVGDPSENTANKTFDRTDQDGNTYELNREVGLRELANILGQPETIIRELLTGEAKFAYVARSVDPPIQQRIQDLHIPGITSRPVQKRTYPLGAVGGSVIGYVNDAGGAAGVELSLNDRLSGTNGHKTYQTGADGIIIPMAPVDVEPAVDGQLIKLTIDSDLQYQTQLAIETQVEKLHADWGNIIVVEAKTGKIRAMAETHSVDPNVPSATAAADRGARSVQAAIEPGSTEKAITAAAAIEEGKIAADSHLVVPPTFTINGQTFSDSFAHGTESRTFAGIIGSSMNTGTVMVGKSLSKQERYDYLRKFGIGETTGIPLPGESPGLLAPPEKWDGRQEFTILFGQGVSQTPLQTVLAFQTIANNGLRLKPQLIESYIDPDGTEHRVDPEPGTRAVSKDTAQQVRDILESVVTVGGATDIKVPGYRVGGKTGTAEAVGERGGFDGYTASFVGMAPMDDPKFVVLVNVQRPQGNIYGISTAPVFNDIMGEVLAKYHVAPSEKPSVQLPQKY